MSPVLLHTFMGVELSVGTALPPESGTGREGSSLLPNNTKKLGGIKEPLFVPSRPIS